MRTYSGVAIGALVMVGALSILPLTRDVMVSPAYAVCMAGDRIDGSTANDALRRFSSAGYAGVHDLRKGCDNYWHGVATQNGSSVRVVLSPTGQVIHEGD